MCINSFGKLQNKNKQKQNFFGETSFFQHNLNSGGKRVTDNKLQVYYFE